MVWMMRQKKRKNKIETAIFFPSPKHLARNKLIIDEGALEKSLNQNMLPWITY